MRVGVLGVTSGAFGQRVAAELAPRLEFKCKVRLLIPTDSAETIARTNTAIFDPAVYGWAKGAAWDAMTG